MKGQEQAIIEDNEPIESPVVVDVSLNGKYAFVYSSYMYLYKSVSICSHLKVELLLVVSDYKRDTF